jgi:hypothetical protein
MLDDADPDEGQIVSLPGDELMLDEEENKEALPIFSHDPHLGL